METQKNLIKSILAVMEDVKNIDKNLKVGDGASSYKGVADKDVKLIIGSSMQHNGLVMIPVSIEPQTKIERWEEQTQYGTKNRQQVFTEVKTKYLLMHESGESIEIEGYGHGVDSQDKSAGKATTYALKYALLYTFLTPTGSIDDTDTAHSDSIDIPQKKYQTSSDDENKKWLNVLDNNKNFTKEWLNIKEGVKAGKINNVSDVRKYYKVSKEVELKINELFNPA